MYTEAEWDVWRRPSHDAISARPQPPSQSPMFVPAPAMVEPCPRCVSLDGPELDAMGAAAAAAGKGQDFFVTAKSSILYRLTCYSRSLTLSLRHLLLLLTESSQFLDIYCSN